MGRPGSGVAIPPPTEVEAAIALPVDAKPATPTRFLNWSDVVMFVLGSVFAMVAPVFKWMFFYTSFKAVFNLTGYDLTTIILDSVKLVIPSQIEYCFKRGIEKHP